MVPHTRKLTSGKFDDSVDFMDNEAATLLKARAQQLVERLIDAGLRPEAISAKLDGRVSSRTIYRWLSGLHGPQQASDIRALEVLLVEIESASQETTQPST